MEKLSFQKVRNNAKLEYMGKGAYTFSLLSGFSCKGAKDCLSFAIKKNNKFTIKDGRDTKWRCFSATAEARHPVVYKSRLHNLNLLKNKTESEMFELLKSSLPKDIKILRLFVAGDFFSEDFFKAVCKLAKAFPNILLYGYTKSIRYLVDNLNLIPENLKLVASRGGKWDGLIDEYNLKNVTVVYSEEEAKEKGLKIDHDDKLAYEGTKNFSLLIHGTQPKGTFASQSLQKLKGISGYSKNNNIKRSLINSLIQI